MTITRKRAVEIAEGWYSVNTWGDPGVALYAFTSTAGWVQSEEHRQNCLSYLRDCQRDLEDTDDLVELAELIEYIEQAELDDKHYKES